MSANKSTFGAKFNSILENLSFFSPPTRSAPAQITSLHTSKSPIWSPSGLGQNQLLPVNDFPTEIITEILLSVCRAWDHGYYHALFRLASVCKLWHNVIVNTPGFWVVIDFNESPSLVDIALSRSKSSPLVIKKAHLEGEHAQVQYLRTIIPHSHRWATVHLVWLNHPHEHDGVLMLSTPLLRTFGLTVAHSGLIHSLPPGCTLFNGTATRLREFHLYGTISPWSSLDFPLLQRLKLQRTSFTLQELHALLSRHALLQEIELDDISLLSTEINNLVGIKLPYLQRLFLPTLPLEAVKLVLGWISAPSCNQLRIRAIMASDGNEGHEGIMFRDLMTHIAGTLPNILTSVSHLDALVQDTSYICETFYDPMDRSTIQPSKYFYVIVQNVRYGLDCLKIYADMVPEASIALRLYLDRMTDERDIEVLRGFRQITYVNFGLDAFGSLSNDLLAQPDQHQFWAFPELTQLYIGIPPGFHKAVVEMLKARYGLRSKAKVKRLSHLALYEFKPLATKEEVAEVQQLFADIGIHFT